MEESIREASVGDNRSLIELQRRCPMGTSLLLALDGSPDYFARSKPYKDWHTLVVVENSRIIGSASYALRETAIEGEMVRTAYEYGFIVDPSRRRKGIATKLQKEIENRVEGRVEFLELNITEDNVPSRNLFTKIGFRAVKECVAYMLMVYREQKGVDETHVRVMEEADIPNVVEMINDTLRGYSFYQPLTRESFLEYYRRLPHYDLKDILVYDDHGIEACLGYWNYDRVMKFTVERFNWRWSFLSAMLKVIGAFIAMPRMPKRGEQISNWYFTPVAYKDPEGLAELIKYVINLALKQKVTFISAPLGPASPIASVFEKFRHNKGKFDWYLKSMGQRTVPDLSDKLLYIDVVDL